MAAITEDRALDVLAEYDRALRGAALSPQSRRAYRSRVAGYLTWLTSAAVGAGDPLAEPPARDAAVDTYRVWLKAAQGCKATTVNAALTALDHFYEHLRLGRALVAREELPVVPPRVLRDDEQERLLRTAARHASLRDRAIAFTLFFTGIRVAELVALDVPDIQVVRTRRRRLIVWEDERRGYREIPLQDELQPVLRTWMTERRRWAGADRVPAFFLNRRGGRLSTRSVDDLVVRIGQDAGIAGDGGRLTPHVLRHTFGARLIRGGTDISEVAELMGHKRIDTTRRYSADPEGSLDPASEPEAELELLLNER